MSPPSDSAGGLVDPRVGTVLADRYRIDALIGEGGMGKVYAAEHVLMRKRVAVKVLHRELTSVPEVVARFEREAMAAANIEHSNVAAATDFGKLADGAVFLVLEFVQGKSLRDEIAEGPFQVDRALHVTRQIAAALAAAHAQGIVHRDLKPENVMLVEKGGEPDFVKVLDFGIAKVPIGEVPAAAGGAPITKAGMVFGTPEYMAPEQALGQNVDGRADLYALGVILFEMLAGVRPFTSQSQVGILGQQLSKPPPTFAERAPGIIVPPAAEQVTHKLLQRESAQRFQSAAELLQTIDLLLAPLPGRGGYRYTLADGSPGSMRGSQPSYGGLVPPSGVAIDFGEPPSLSSSPGASPIPRAPSDPRASADPLAPLAPVSPARQKLAEFVRSVERSRGSWPAPVRDTLRHVPTPALLVFIAFVSAALCVLGIAFVIGLVHVVRGPAPVASSSAIAPPSASVSAPVVVTPPPPSELASPADLAAAEKSGIAALEALSKKFPNDPTVLVALGHATARAREYVRAVGAIGHALSLEPKLAENDQIASTLFQTAQAKGSSDATFAVLTGAMGSRGADIVYDLATTESVKPWVRARAETWLHSQDFDRVSSPPLNIAVALRFASACPQRYALLLRAKNVGDERSLPYLHKLETTTGCGKKHDEDCNACLRADKRLDETIEAIGARKH
jgi:serine/threonine-protein kinase